MTTTDGSLNNRILIVDDTPSIHEDFRKLLGIAGDDRPSLKSMRAALLGDDDAPNGPGSRSMSDRPKYELDSAFQGQEALHKVRAAVDAGRPYAMAFVDMRMPPGWDGLETVQNLWAADPHLQIAICTAYSDYSWDEIISKLGLTDQLLLLKKPFDIAEAWQMACAMTKKWALSRQAEMKALELGELVNERTRELNKTNDRLQHEINERRQAEERLRHNALHDILTDLPNRALLTERLDRCVLRAQRQADYHFAVLFMDLDNFKFVNDSLGHRIGDKLLIGIASRLTACLRALDTTARPLDRTAARLGGDEFVILLDGIKNLENAKLVAQRVHDALKEPFDLEGQQVIATMSIGITMDDPEVTDADTYMLNADTALYEAKRRGKRNTAVFDTELRANTVDRLRLEMDLRQAIEGMQLRTYYQPIVSIESGKIHSLEALARWQHPQRGLLAAGLFIPIAESSSLIVDIGKWILRDACAQARDWRLKHTDHRELTICVNLSARQLANADIVETIRQVLEETGLEPDGLCLEITETMVLSNASEVAQIIKMIKDMGVAVHLDDFGTGYSSLSYLHDLPVSAIKIDRSFIKNMGLDGRHAATIQAIVSLAHNRSIQVIAEGVETLEQFAQVQALECDYVQGYYFSKPVEPDQIDRLIASDGEWFRIAS
jgi:diguanylate cyclase (GGDEF)-like protein